MGRLLCIFFIFTTFYIYPQPSTKEWIDSLNTIDNHEKKVDLALKIASQLQDSDWDRAIKYVELAETEAKKTNKADLALAKVYLSAGEIYSSKDVLDITLQYYLKAYVRIGLSV